MCNIEFNRYFASHKKSKWWSKKIMLTHVMLLYVQIKNIYLIVTYVIMNLYPHQGMLIEAISVHFAQAKNYVKI